MNNKIWYKDVDKRGWKALLAGGIGWTFEAYDVYILSLTLPAIISAYGLTHGQGGAIASIESVGLLVGGIINGWLSDRIGRKKSLGLAVLIYSVFTCITPFAANFHEFAALRFLAGLGMGGEWVAGSALIAETWSAKTRGKGGTIMQTGLPIGSLMAIGLASLVSSINGGSLEDGGWKVMYFFVFIALLFSFYVFWKTPESPIWLNSKNEKAKHNKPSNPLADLFVGGQFKKLVIAYFFVFFLQYVYWAVFTWVPEFLVTVKHMAYLNSMAFTLVQQIGSLVGFIIFGALVDKIGRKAVFIPYLIIGAISMFIFTYIADKSVLFIATFFTGFGISGMFAGLGPWTAEMMPKGRSRGLMMGIAYNGGRLGGVVAPWVVGTLASTAGGFQVGMITTVIAFILAIIVMLLSKETKGIELE